MPEGPDQQVREAFRRSSSQLERGCECAVQVELEPIVKLSNNEKHERGASGAEVAMNHDEEQG